MAAHSPVEGLGARALQHVVILDVPACWLQVCIILRVGGAIGLVEDVVLKLRGGHCAIAHRRRGLNLPAQEGARRKRHRLRTAPVLLFLHVADHQRRALEPGGHAQR